MMQTIILYSPKESARRMSEYRQEKEEAISAAKEISPIGADSPELQQNDEPKNDENQPEQNKEEIVEDFFTPVKATPKRKSKPKQLKIDDITSDDKME